MEGGYKNGAGNAHKHSDQHFDTFGKKLYGTFNIFVPNLRILEIDPILSVNVGHKIRHYWLVKIRREKETYYGWAFRQSTSRQKQNTLEILTSELLPEELKKGELDVEVVNLKNLDLIDVYFPKDDGRKYYEFHHNYVLNLFKYMKFKVNLATIPPVMKTAFEIKIAGKQVVIDFNNFEKLGYDPNQYKHIFKFHYNENNQEHTNAKNMYAFNTISFFDWNDYYRLKNKIKYQCNNDMILNNQKPRAKAVARRIAMQKKLTETYGKQNVDFELGDQKEYWNKINNCLTHVFVHGARVNMLDRGQNQFFAFGCCTVGAELFETLPFNKKIIDGTHYIKTKNDYSDLSEKIEWIKNNKDKAIQIGNNAKKLFEETSTPEKKVLWMLTRII